MGNNVRGREVIITQSMSGFGTGAPVKLEASFQEAIRIANKQKSISLEKRAEATYAEYRRQKRAGQEDVDSDSLFDVFLERAVLCLLVVSRAASHPFSSICADNGDAFNGSEGGRTGTVAGTAGKNTTA